MQRTAPVLQVSNHFRPFPTKLVFKYFRYFDGPFNSQRLCGPEGFLRFTKTWCSWGHLKAWQLMLATCKRETQQCAKLAALAAPCRWAFLQQKLAASLNSCSEENSERILHCWNLSHQICRTNFSTLLLFMYQGAKRISRESGRVHSKILRCSDIVLTYYLSAGWTKAGRGVEYV